MKSVERKLRVIILTHGEVEPLINRLIKLDDVEIVGVYVETEINRRVYTLRERFERSIRYDGYWVTLGKLARILFRKNGSSYSEAGQIRAGQHSLQDFAGALQLPLYYVSNYHTDESIALMREANADLGIVWGTNILKERVFKIPRMGSINIHQGLAPDYRGGPPVFWELYNNEPTVGVTVHFVEPKVDTGEILCQESIPLQYDYSYGLNFEAFIADYRGRMQETCVRLMTDAVEMISQGTAQLRTQDLTRGKRYRMPIKEEKDEIRRRLRQRRQAASLAPHPIPDQQ